MHNGKLAIVHTVSSLVTVFKQLCAELLPGVDVYHVVDESLLKDAILNGKVTPLVSLRLLSYCTLAEQGGATAVLVSCSSMGNAVAQCRPFMGIPVVRVDEAMIGRALQTGRRIGVFATLTTTLDPTVSLLESVAKDQAEPPEVFVKCCAGAFEAMASGDADRHDEIIISEIRKALSKVDVIILAQASMARVIAKLTGAELKVPILTSPRLAVEYLADNVFARRE
jgi:Asp/Glu/hydantoin racemase